MADGVPDAVKMQILQDPAVQSMIRNEAKRQGTDAVKALQDPKVQEQIMETCKNKFPEYSAIVTAKITEFASDPDVQKQAKIYLSMAGQYVRGAGGMLVAQIQQGPSGVRLLCFIAGVVSCVVSVLAIINPLMIIFGTVGYIMSVYQVFFSLTTMMFEAKPEWIEKIPGCDKYQSMLIEKARFLSETLGRGLFYIFQGSVWLTFASMTDISALIAGVCMVFVGLLNLLIHYGGYTQFAEKVMAGYKALGGEEKESNLK